MAVITFQSIFECFKMITITRSSTCRILNLPEELACILCKPSICKAEVSGKAPQRIKKGLRTFGERWKEHREMSKVELYYDIVQFMCNSENYKDTTIDVEEICGNTTDNDTSGSDDLSSVSEDLLPKYVTPLKDATAPIPEIITPS